MTKINNNQSVYIQSIEASQIYNHINRDDKIKSDYVGMIPYSLELIKLHSIGLKTFTNKTTTKLMSDDIINVKFNTKVKSGDEIIAHLNKKIKTEELDVEYLVKLEEFIDYIQNDNDKKENKSKWESVSNHDLRKILYNNGFTINGTHYVVYKRSSSKSRTGQVLFIKQSLHKRMMDWSRLGLPFEQNSEVDLASLLAYESLVGSSIIDTVQIDSSAILLVDDVTSTFSQVANVVRQNDDTGYLESVTKETEITNDLFDGQSLLDSSLFVGSSKSKGFMQLRNRMFKTAAFNTNITQFMMDNCPVDVDFDDWQITDMFGNKMYAKDVKMITTPNSLKVLKFSYLLGSESAMYKHWKQVVADEGNLFGICMYEDNEGRGHDEEGNVLQQTSYQMINSLKISDKQMKDLTEFEVDYIEKLKNDDEFFVAHMMEKANEMNSNEMLASLYEINSKVVNTKMFRDFRKAEINRHVTHVKRGKLRLKGNYAVMVGNPVEMLYHAIGAFNVDEGSMTLQDNQIHTTMFKSGKKLTGFRNPHTSPSNVLVAHNVHNELISKYFNLTDNIVAVNAINFAIQDKLSGSDYDGDTVALFDDKTLLQVAESVQDYNVCINAVEGQKVVYRLNTSDMSVIDNSLQKSGKMIGEVVNLGQEIMSKYWDEGAQNNELMQMVDVTTVLSGISIDLVKKMYDLDIASEVKNVKKLAEIGKIKPEFFRWISQSKTIRSRVKQYDTAMDHLQIEMDKLKAARYRKNLSFGELLVKKDKRKGNRAQQRKIVDYVNEMNDTISMINSKSEDKDEKFESIDNVIKYYEFFIQKLKVNENTMYSILDSVTGNNSNIAMRLMNVLYVTQKDTFLSAFKVE